MMVPMRRTQCFQSSLEARQSDDPWLVYGTSTHRIGKGKPGHGTAGRPCRLAADWATAYSITRHVLADLLSPYKRLVPLRYKQL